MNYTRPVVQNDSFGKKPKPNPKQNKTKTKPLCLVKKKLKIIKDIKYSQELDFVL